MPRSNPSKRQHLKESRFESAEEQPLTCARWMSSQLHTVKPLDSVARARALLERHRINQLPVVKDGMLVGIVTDRDLRDAFNAVTTSATLAGTAEPAPQTPDEIPVEAVMTPNVITLALHSTVLTAAELMQRERIGALPIVDGQTLAGILTRSDILAAFVSRENARSEPAGRAANQDRNRETTGRGVGVCLRPREPPLARRMRSTAATFKCAAGGSLGLDTHLADSFARFAFGSAGAARGSTREP